MFFGADDEEMDFSSGSGRTKLASLFDMDRAAGQGGNESLMYTAPKEPKKRPDGPTQSAAGSATAPAVLCLGVAFAYKFKDDKYESEGKLGVAVIGNHVNSDYKLLLYYTKEKPVAFAKIDSTFLFTVQPNNYVNFYDDSRQSWSLMFESESVLLQFVKQVAVCKFLNGQSSNRDLVISQDLSPGEGHALEAGDNIEIKYTGWQLENNAIGSTLESGQLFRFRIGKQKGIRAWEEGVVGMKKNGKRLLICAPSMATGGEFRAGKFPAGIPLVFEVEVVRVKFGRERADDASVPAATPSSVPQVANDDKDDEKEDGIRAKSKSIADQMAQQSSKTDKAKLISRMAKMGQPMLPVAVAPQTDNAEAEATSPSPSARPEVPMKPAQHGTSAAQHGYSAMPASATMPTAVNIMPETQFIPQNVMPPMGHMMAQQPFQGPASMPGMMPAATGQLSVYHPQLPMPYQAMMGYPGVSAGQPFGSMYSPSQIYAAQPPQPPPPQPPPVSQSVGDTSVPMMLMETRNQNTEVRVSLSRVSDKVDRIAEKLDQLSLRQSSAVSLSNSMPTMEVGMLVSNIERIVMDNERLKKENMEKSSRVEEQNIKIAELLQRNQLYVEQSNAFLEQRNDSYKNTASQSQARVQSLEQEKVQLAMDLSMTTSQLASCQLEVNGLKKREGELKQQLDRLVTADIQGREDFGSMRLRLAEQELRLDQLGAQLKEEQQEKRLLTKQTEDLRENLNDLTMERDNLDRNFNEKKRKATEEISRMETETKEMQTNFEAELTTLKNRLKVERNSTESTTAQKLTQIEDDLNREWKEKCDRLVSSAQEKHQRELVEVNNEKAWLQERLDTAESKLAEFKSFRSAHEQEKEGLKEQVEQLGSWKDKYENLRSQATSMKERYEQRIKEVEEEQTAADDEREKAEQERNKAEEKARRLQVQLTTSQQQGGASGTENARDAVAAEVKKIMNTVYRKLRQEFSPGGTYEGSAIQTIILDNVKAITLEMMQTKGPADVSGGASVSVERPSAVTFQVETSVARAAAPLSTTEAPPLASLSEPNSSSNSGSYETSPESLESSHSVGSATDLESSIISPSTTTGASGSDIPYGSNAGKNPASSENPDVIENENVRSRETPQVQNAITADVTEKPVTVHVFTQEHVTPEHVTPEHVTLERVTPEHVTPEPVTPEHVTPERVTPKRVTPERVTPEHVTPERMTLEHVSPEHVTPEHVTQESVTEKAVVDEDEDSFESFGSGDREDPGKLEGGKAERETVVENVEDVTEVAPDGSKTPGGSRHIDAEENSNVGAVDDDDDEDLFSTMDKIQVSGSKGKQANVDETASADAAPVTITKDIPLFGEDDDDDVKGDAAPSQVQKNPAPKSSSLFGGLDEEDDDGLFSLASKSVLAERKTNNSRPSSGKQNSANDQKKSTNKPKRNESDDDLAQKPPPLPLFGDSDDDKDLDWLS